MGSGTKMGSETKMVERQITNAKYQGAGMESVLTVVKEILGDLMASEPGPSGKPGSLLQRSRDVVTEKAPRLKRAVKFTSDDLLKWMNRGGPLRAFLVASTGIVSVVGLSAVFIFVLLLVTATVNTAIVALLGTVAAVGAVTALFFTSLAAIYIGAVSMAAFTISVIAFFTIAAAITAAGWIAFWWVIWQGAQKGLDMARGSIALTAATIQNASTLR